MPLSSRSWRILQNLRRSVQTVVHYAQSSQQVPRLKSSLRNKKSFGNGGYIMLLIPGAAFCLGTWQIQRLQWKLGLIADLETRTTHPAVPLPLDLEELKDLEYRRVKVRGTFDHSREMYIGPRSKLEDAKRGYVTSGSPNTGMNVVTPFKLADRNLTVLVNRGWVSVRHMKGSTRPAGQIEGEVDLTGVVRLTDQKNNLMPSGKPDRDGYWLYREVEAMAEKAGTEPVFLDADQFSTVEGGPIGGQTKVTLRNEHVQYIFTWYLLAGITFWMWFRRYRRPPTPPSAMNYYRRQE